MCQWLAQTTTATPNTKQATHEQHKKESGQARHEGCRLAPGRGWPCERGSQLNGLQEKKRMQTHHIRKGFWLRAAYAFHCLQLCSRKSRALCFVLLQFLLCPKWDCAYNRTGGNSSKPPRGQSTEGLKTSAAEVHRYVESEACKLTHTGRSLGNHQRSLDYTTQETRQIRCFPIFWSC